MKKLKPCPMCGWTNTQFMLMDFDKFNRPCRYFFQCTVCGFRSKKSRFRTRAVRLWNKIKPNSKKKNRHHIFGLEF